MRSLTDEEIAAAADLLVAARAGRVYLAGLPAELTPDTTVDMQRIIDAVTDQVDRPIRGWKAYCLYKPMNPPVCAPVYDVLTCGAEIPATISPARLIEPEIMFRADRDLPARDDKYSVAEVMESVTAVVGFEVIGSRFRADPAAEGDSPTTGQGSLLGSLADHLANGCVVIGDPIPEWRSVAFETVRLRVTEGDREFMSVVGCHPFDDPFLPVVVGVNRLRHGRGVRAGEVILTNSSTSFFAVAADTEIRATYEGVGSVVATFAAG